MTPVKRLVRGYRKGEDWLDIEVPLRDDLPLALLQEWFEVPADEPMYDCYPISLAQLINLRPYLEGEVDPTEHDLFLECDAV